jgi:translocation and assembly module TamB
MRARRLIFPGLLVLGVGLAVLLLGAGGFLLFLRSDAGAAWITARIEAAANSPDQKLTITGLGGDRPASWRIGHAELADRDGTWLRLDDLALDFDLGALLRGTARVERLAIRRVEVLRQPLPSRPSSRSESGPAAPPLPVELGKLELGTVSLAPALLGVPATFSAEGAAVLHAANASLVLRVRRHEGGEIALKAEYGADRLDLALHASDPAGDLVGALLDRAPLPASLALTGSGPIASWKGKIAVDAGPDSGLEADLSLAMGREIAVAVTGDARLAALLPEKARGIAGPSVAFDIAGKRDQAGKLALERAGVTLAAGTVAGRGSYEPRGDRIDGRVDATADLAPLAPLVGRTLVGKATIAATIAGTAAEPQIKLSLSGKDIAVEQLTASGLDAALELAPAAAGRFHATGSGGITGIGVPAGLGNALAWSIDATTDRSGRSLVLDRVTAEGAGVALAATGRLESGAASGHVSFTAADLSLFAPLTGTALAGRAELVVEAKSPGDGSLAATLGGRLGGFRSGVPAADALTGPEIAIAGNASRGPDGTISLARFNLSGSRMELQAQARLPPGAARPEARANLALSDLAPLGRALGTALAGAATLDLAATGTAAKAILTAHGAIGDARLDRLDVTADLPDLDRRAGNVTILAKSAATTARLDASLHQEGASRLVLDRLALDGPATEGRGAGSADLASGLVSGKLALRATELAGWSRLAGQPLRGRLDLDLGLDAAKGQAAELKLAAQGLGIGSGADAMSLESLTASARLSGLRQRPEGTVSLDATGIAAPRITIDHVGVRGKSAEPGSYELSLAGAGTAEGKHVAIDSAATLGVAGASQRLVLDRVAGSIDTLALRLERPATLERTGTKVALRDLALAVGSGRIAGSGSFDGKAVTATFTGNAVPAAELAALAGHGDIEGRLGFDLALAGPVASPEGHATLALDGLKIGAGDRTAMPAIGLSASAVLAPGALAFKGRIDGERNAAALGFSGSVPLMPGPALDRNGALSGKLEGEGRLEALDELAPIGEDRMAGGYAIDLRVEGTPAAPRAAGTLRVSDASYDNLLSGLTLRGLQLELTGRGGQYEVTRFEANDGGDGRLETSGRIDLEAAGGPSFDVTTRVRSFAAARTDTVSGTISGSTRIDGNLAAPRVSGELTIDRADVSLPDRLPPNIVVLDVVRVDSRHPGAKPVPPLPPTSAVVARLDVKLHDSGRTFVRGRGLDSEWKGDIAIAGTSADPAITGQLQSVNGTYSILGKDFTFSRGLVFFTGSMTPSFDIEAQAVTSDVTAIVDLRGTPDKPSITLSSTPALPQDEVLSRVMFGSGTTQLSPAQGLQLAQAAASLAGGGPSMIDRLRGFTGLDRLSLGSAAPAPGSTSSQGGSGVASGTTVSGGRYVAPGVYVGAEQGLGGSTRAKVEVNITPHVTVNAAAGAGGNGGSSVGVQYQRDY